MVTVWTSQASLTQRTGRAGRTSEGFCWRLCSEEFAKQQLLPQTPPEMVRTPLDELILKICLLYEQRRDDFYKSLDTMKKRDAGGRAPRFATGVRPMKFLSQTPTPPDESSLIQVCRHLIEINALKVVEYGSTEDEMKWLYRLTPLGYHLSRLPSLDVCNIASEDALITSCCLVAGLYPGGPRGRKLLTSDGDECHPSSSSFQHKRVRDASETGKDAYAVYHAKHRTLSAVKHRAPGIFLSEVNFVSKFALLLFGGELELIKNGIIVDGWLKFKISDDGESKGKTEVENAVLILSLRSLMDDVMNEHVIESCSSSEVRAEMTKHHQGLLKLSVRYWLTLKLFKTFSRCR